MREKYCSCNNFLRKCKKLFSTLNLKGEYLMHNYPYYQRVRCFVNYRLARGANVIFMKLAQSSDERYTIII